MPVVDIPVEADYATLRTTLRWRMAVLLAALILALMLVLGVSNQRMGFDDTSRLAWIVAGCAFLSLLGLWRLPRALGAALFFAMVAGLVVFAITFGWWHGRAMAYWAFLFPPVVVFLLRARFALLAMVAFGAFTAWLTSTLAPAIDVIRFASVYGLLICFVTTYAVLEERAGALLKHRSLRDPLTGCLNRRAFNERMATLHRSRGHAPVALLLLDLDHFKAINDHHGHLVGDSVLRGVAKGLMANLQAPTRAYRYGGEEFAVLGEGLGEADALALAERLRGIVRTGLPEHPGIELGVSIGVAAWRPAAESPESALQRADAALYAAKDAGRNRVVSHAATH
jgi:diguanylate cyclase (GGDEF)-like protein